MQKKHQMVQPTYFKALLQQHWQIFPSINSKIFSQQPQMSWNIQQKQCENKL